MTSEVYQNMVPAGVEPGVIACGVKGKNKMAKNVTGMIFSVTGTFI